MSSLDSAFRASFEHSRDGMLVTDPQGRILVANLSAYRILAAAPGSLAGAQLPKDRLPAEPSLHPLEDGRRLWILRDPPDAELRASEERLRATLESTPDVAVQWYDEQGRVLFWNPASEKMFGYRASETIGRTLDRLIHTPGEFRIFLDTLRRVRAQGSPCGPAEYSFRRRDGSSGTCLSTIFEIPGPHGTPQFVCMDVDLSERKRLEQQFVQAQRLEGVARLAGGVAHDFNNLLTTILGFGELARRALPQDSPVAGHLDQVLQAGRKGASLTRRILGFSRRQQVHSEVVRLDAAVALIAPLLSPLLGETLRLDLDLRAGDAAVRLDPAGLEQAVLNLSINARDAMPGGGRLGLRTGADGQTAFVSVEDDGEGMSAEVRARLFEAFFTTKPAGRGTGLGLVMVHQFATQSGGSVEVRSEPGRGSEFRIRLPLCPVPPDPLPVPAPDLDLPGGAERLLLVEDQDPVREFASALLGSCGYRVTSAPGGEAALRLAGDAPHPFHLLVTDVVMPGMNGRDLAARLTARFPSLRILYTSGDVQDETLRAEIESRGLAFLPKPYTPQSLARKVRQVLDS